MTRAGWVVFIGAIALAVMAGIGFAFDRNDFQSRFSDTMSWRLDASWSMYLYQELNLGDDASNFHCQVHEVGAVYSGLAQWIDLSGAYVKVYSKSNREWLDENVPYCAGTLKWKIAGWDISDKNRFEFDQKQKAEDDWSYRNYIFIASPFKLTHFEIQPYLADEIFYNFDEDRLTLNEFRSGFNFKLTKHAGAGLYYLLRHTHVNDAELNVWKRSAHVLALEVKISF